MDLNNFPFAFAERVCKAIETKMAGKFRVYHNDGSMTRTGELSGVMTPDDYMNWLRTYRPNEVTNVKAAVPDMDLTGQATDMFDKVRRALATTHGQGRDADHSKVGTVVATPQPSAPNVPPVTVTPGAQTPKLPKKPKSSVIKPPLATFQRPQGPA